MHARVSMIEGSQERIDDGIKMLETETLPELEQVDGYCGILSLVDRESGKSIIVTLWESEQAMRASEARANTLRSDAASRLGMTGSPTVERYECTLHEVRTPVHA
jgi:heme-degrading monooxygenase HmoA